MPVPLLGPQEKSELEALILERLGAYYDANGPASLLRPGTGIVVNANGVSVAAAISRVPEALASVEARTLFTAVCHLASEGAMPIPREMLATLAAEAATAATTQINRIAPD